MIGSYLLSPLKNWMNTSGCEYCRHNPGLASRKASHSYVSHRSLAISLKAGYKHSASLKERQGEPYLLSESSVVQKNGKSCPDNQTLCHVSNKCSKSNDLIRILANLWSVLGLALLVFQLSLLWMRWTMWDWGRRRSSDDCGTPSSLLRSGGSSTSPLPPWLRLTSPWRSSLLWSAYGKEVLWNQTLVGKLGNFNLSYL